MGGQVNHRLTAHMLGVLTSLLRGWRLYALAGLAGALLLIGVYQAGVHAERTRGQAAQLRVELETVRRDATLAEAARQSADAKAQTLAAEAAHDQEELDALRKALAARPAAGRHPATADDLDLLYPR